MESQYPYFHILVILDFHILLIVYKMYIYIYQQHCKLDISTIYIVYVISTNCMQYFVALLHQSLFKDIVYFEYETLNNLVKVRGSDSFFISNLIYNNNLHNICINSLHMIYTLSLAGSVNFNSSCFYFCILTHC